MKATGIVRRIDDLGRVVIPKEIRRTIRIREGDPLEIFTDNNGEVIFKKYSPMGELSDFAGDCANVVHQVTGRQTVICDRDHIIVATGNLKKELIGRRISSQLEEIMTNRKNYILTNGSESIAPIEGAEYTALTISTIIVSGDVCGAVILINSDNDKCTDADAKVVQSTALFLAKQMEE